MDKQVTLEQVERLGSCYFILGSKMAELNQLKIKIQNNQIDQIRCQNFILSRKQINS